MAKVEKVGNDGMRVLFFYEKYVMKGYIMLHPTP